jgi:hypothetical protein
MSLANGKVIPVQIASLYIAYSLLALLVTLWIDGLSIDLPPKFSYEYASEQFGSEIVYGQGISSFFGLSAIVVIFLWTKQSMLWLKATTIGIACIFLALSMLGGARGDTSIALILIILIVAYNSPWKTIIFFITALSIGTIFIDWSWLMELNYFAAMMLLWEGNFGLRDEYTLDVLRLLLNQPVCMILGCGIGYFQKYYGYDAAMYPHNAVLEFIVIFGLPFAIIYFVMMIYGIYFYIKKHKEIDLFFIFFLFYFAISLKSGSLFGSSFMFAGSIYFTSLCLVRLISNVSNPKKSLIICEIF